MTFEEFLESQKSTLAVVDARVAAEIAWDAALCAATMAMFERGERLPAHEAHGRISALHSWAARLAEQPAAETEDLIES